MTQEQKELLLKDLCARLPYRVKGNYQNSDDELLRKVTIMYSYLQPNGMVMTGDIKPYLFPLESMTEEQRIEYDYLHSIIFSCFEDDLSEAIAKLYNWFNKNHFDYNNLIPMGLAIDATGLNIY